MTITTRMVDYELDGQAFDGFLAFDDEGAGERPCVMICHAWGGRKDHEEEAAKRVAELGYVAFAADIFGKGVRGESTEECQNLITPLLEERETLRARLSKSLETMTAQAEADAARAAVSGYCFGGLCALDMARINAPVLGVTAFHSLFGTTEETGTITPKVLALQGYDDPLAAPDAQRAFTDEMTRRKADWQLHLYGGVSHAFTNEGANDPNLGLQYDVKADARSWATFENFLAELFG